MKILHTADWHIGRMLYSKKRYAEFEGFLTWLEQVITDECVDVLLIAGDVFDTTMPSHRALDLYYDFLNKMAVSCCRHVVVIAGNHDSPALLNGPKHLLRRLDIHVVGHTGENIEDEVIVLKTALGVPELIVCAVPYLRDKDIRLSEAGESIGDKERKLMDGIQNHYAAIALLAEQKRLELSTSVPIVAMGHLFAAGAQAIEGDGMRELYVGSLAHVSANIFPATFDYVALGHLHSAQQVGGLNTVRYSGSPIPMCFGEAGRAKSVCLLDFSTGDTVVRHLQVPLFQKLDRISGDKAVITAQLQELAASGAASWVEITYNGSEVAGDLNEYFGSIALKAPYEILRIRNDRAVNRQMAEMHADQTLDDLGVDDVFAQCLAINNVPAEQHATLKLAYAEIIAQLHSDDGQDE